MGEKKSEEVPERWSAQRKTEIVLRLLRGLALDEVSRGVQVHVHELEEWRRVFLDSGIQGLKKRGMDPEEREVRRLQAKIGEMTMRLELAEHLLEKKGVRGRPEKAEAMKEQVSPGAKKAYPLSMICREWKVSTPVEK